MHKRQGMALPFLLEQLPMQTLRNEAGKGGAEKDEDCQQRLRRPGTEKQERRRAIRFCAYVLKFLVGFGLIYTMVY